MSRLVLRFREGHSASTDLPFSGRLDTDEAKRDFQTAVRASLKNLLDVARYGYRGSTVAKLEALIWDPQFRDRYRKELVPADPEKLQERLDDEERDRAKPFVGQVLSTFEEDSARSRPKEPLAAVSGEETRLRTEVTKLETPEDFLEAEGEG